MSLLWQDVLPCDASHRRSHCSPAEFCPLSEGRFEAGTEIPRLPSAPLGGGIQNRFNRCPQAKNRFMQERTRDN